MFKGIGWTSRGGRGDVGRCAVGLINEWAPVRREAPDSYDVPFLPGSVLQLETRYCGKRVQLGSWLDRSVKMIRNSPVKNKCMMRTNWRENWPLCEENVSKIGWKCKVFRKSYWAPFMYVELLSAQYIIAIIHSIVECQGIIAQKWNLKIWAKSLNFWYNCHF